MNRFEYIVESIDGDYAHLRRTDIESDELKLVAARCFRPRSWRARSCYTSGCSIPLWNNYAKF